MQAALCSKIHHSPGSLTLNPFPYLKSPPHQKPTMVTIALTLTAPNAIACWIDQIHKCLQIYPTTPAYPQDLAPIHGFAEAWAYRWIGWSPCPFSQA